MKYDVFISYSRRDLVGEDGSVNPQSVVAQLLTHLDNARLKYWIDRDGIYTGDEFQEVICTAIEESRVFLFVSSEASNASSWTPGEVSTAVDLGMPIVPFRVDGALYNKKIRIRLAPLDRIDLFRLGDKGFPTLINSLTEQVKRVMDIEKEKERIQLELDEQTLRQKEYMRKQQQLCTQLEIQYNVLTEQIYQNEEKRAQIAARMVKMGMEIPALGKEAALMHELAELKLELHETQERLHAAESKLWSAQSRKKVDKKENQPSVLNEMIAAAEICLKQKFLDIKGRADCKEYWYFMLFELLACLVACLSLIMLEGIVTGVYVSPVMLVWSCLLLGVVFFVPNVTVSIRRLHDIGRSGLWLLLSLIPYIGVLILLAFFCQKSKKEGNKYSK